MIEENKIIFLDIDGPMLPMRAFFLPENNQKNSNRHYFDPIAVSMINRLLETSRAKIVISSSWADQGLGVITKAFSLNNISIKSLHEDWMTPRPNGECNPNRVIEIVGWLNKHPEVTHYVAIDDMQMELKNLVKVTFHDGMLYKHMEMAAKFLNCKIY
jgi:hypothetical protein